MRKNTARHWLHACLDLLPVLLIPVFMIYSHRHDIGTESTYTEQVPVYYESNDVETYTDLLPDNLYLWTDNYQGSYVESDINVFSIKNNDLIRSQFSSITVSSNIYLRIRTNNISLLITNSTNGGNNYVSVVGRQFNFVFDSLLNSQYVSYVIDYISYTDLQVLKGYQEITYDFEKDIMNAFMNNFNFTIDKYFNMGNVFGMTNVYQWFNTNIFGGNAPTIIFSVWNIVLYEFVMDLIFLLYALFMWFIDVTKRLIEKPLESIK